MKLFPAENFSNITNNDFKINENYKNTSLI